MDDLQKKLLDYERDQKIQECLEKERKDSDGKYAIKLVEKAVFAIIGLMGITIAGALIKIAITYINGFLR